MTKRSNSLAMCAGTVTFRLNESGGIEFLLVLPRQGSGKAWGLPKGHCEEGEGIHETAVRETFEETGIVSRLLFELPPVFTTTPKESKVVHCFLAKQLNEGVDPVPQQEEVVEAKWFAIDSLPNIHAYQLPLIKFAVSAIERNLE